MLKHFRPVCDWLSALCHVSADLSPASLFTLWDIWCIDKVTRLLTVWEVLWGYSKQTLPGGKYHIEFYVSSNKLWKHQRITWRQRRCRSWQSTNNGITVTTEPLCCKSFCMLCMVFNSSQCYFLLVLLFQPSWGSRNRFLILNMTRLPYSNCQLLPN